MEIDVGSRRDRAGDVPRVVAPHPLASQFESRQVVSSGTGNESKSRSRGLKHWQGSQEAEFKLPRVFWSLYVVHAQIETQVGCRESTTRDKLIGTRARNGRKTWLNSRLISILLFCSLTKVGGVRYLNYTALYVLMSVRSPKQVAQSH